MKFTIDVGRSCTTKRGKRRKPKRKSKKKKDTINYQLLSAMIKDLRKPKRKSSYLNKKDSFGRSYRSVPTAAPDPGMEIEPGSLAVSASRPAKRSLEQEDDDQKRAALAEELDL